MIIKGSTPPDDAYEVGSRPKGGRKPKWPFNDMQLNDSCICPYKDSSDRNRLFAAIRGVQRNFPSKRFKTVDIVPESGANAGKPCVQVWRVK